MPDSTDSFAQQIAAGAALCAATRDSAHDALRLVAGSRGAIERSKAVMRHADRLLAGGRAPERRDGGAVLGARPS